MFWVINSFHMASGRNHKSYLRLSGYFQLHNRFRYSKTYVQNETAVGINAGTVQQVFSVPADNILDDFLGGFQTSGPALDFCGGGTAQKFSETMLQIFLIGAML